MTNHDEYEPGMTNLTGKSGQVFVRMANGTYAVAPLTSSAYIEKVESIQNMLLARAIGHAADDYQYKTLREELIQDEYIKPLLPRFVVTNRSLAEFWAYIKTKFTTYRERQEFIWGEFKPLLEGLEKGTLSYLSDEDLQPRPLKPLQSSSSLESSRLSNAQSKITILFLAADPTDQARLRLGEEMREIQEKLQLAKLRDRFELQQRTSVRPVDISQALLDVQPNLVHFSGHGTATGSLCFENQVGETHPIQPDALAALFEQFKRQVGCVVLNACYSESQAMAIGESIDYVIGMNQAIGDKAAIAFAIGFYQALGAGRTIEEAYSLGCVQIRLQNIPEHLTPVLIKKRQATETSSEQLLKLRGRIANLLEELTHIKNLHLDHPEDKQWRTTARRYLGELDKILPGSDYVGQYDYIPWHLQISLRRTLKNNERYMHEPVIMLKVY